MTADGLIGRVFSRWLARVDGVSDQLRLGFLMMTGLSTATVALESYGLGSYALPVIAVTGVGVIAWTYIYTEAGLWNQMNRDRATLSDDYAGPGMRMGNEMAARGLMAAMQEGELSDEQVQAVRDELDDVWADYWDGIGEPEQSG